MGRAGDPRVLLEDSLQGFLIWELVTGVNQLVENVLSCVLMMRAFSCRYVTFMKGYKDGNIN